MHSVSAKNLPVKSIASLLEVKNISETWRDILYTYVSQGHPELKHFFLQDDFFVGSEELSENLLDGLSIGNVGVLYEYSLAVSDYESRKESGQYFTPDDVAQLMAEKSDIGDEWVWLDPCSGVGNLTFWLVEQKSSHSIKPAYEILANNILVIDRDPLALFIARVLLTTHFWGEYSGNLFLDCENKFIEQDFLDMERELPEYDFAIVNPPYLRTNRDVRFETSECADLYSYFLERIIKTAQKGFVSITPQSFTNASKFQPLRDMLNKYYKNMSIYCFDNVPDSIFKGVKYGSTNTNTANSTRAAITVFDKQKEVKQEEEERLQSGLFAKNVGSMSSTDDTQSLNITPLLRWRTDQRSLMFSNVDKFLSTVPIEKKSLYPKIFPSLVGFYEEIKTSANLGSVLTNERTSFSLSIPSSPRYFTPALKRDVNRSSVRKIFFHDEEDMNYAYLLLNSSVFYWWWRVVDGGMTISSRTISSLPCVGFTRDIEREQALIREIEDSEKQNLVSKNNAGKSNENVKHPMSLIEKINHYVVPCQYRKYIIGEHMNSVFDRVL